MNQSSDIGDTLQNTPALETSAVLSGEKLAQARSRERLQVMSAIISLILSLVFLTLFTVTCASSALRDALGGNALLPTLAFILVFYRWRTCSSSRSRCISATCEASVLAC